MHLSTCLASDAQKSLFPTVKRIACWKQRTDVGVEHLLCWCWFLYLIRYYEKSPVCVDYDSEIALTAGKNVGEGGTRNTLFEDNNFGSVCVSCLSMCALAFRIATLCTENFVSGFWYGLVLWILGWYLHLHWHWRWRLTALSNSVLLTKLVCDDRILFCSIAGFGPGCLFHPRRLLD